MDDQSKNYFAELAGGRKNITPPEEETETKAAIDGEISPAADIASAAESEPIAAEPVKAERVVVKKPKSRPSSRSKAKDDEDESVSITEHSDSFADDLIGEAEGQLTVDVFQTPDEIVIQSTIAGVRPEDLTVDITSESVSIRGRRERSKSVSDDDYFYQECYWGRFSRSIILPQEINQDKAEASLRDGVLTIRLPKLEREKNKKLRLKIT